MTAMLQRLEKVSTIETGKRGTAGNQTRRRFDAPVSPRLARPEVRPHA
jgi:hypothetical protein